MIRPLAAPGRLAALPQPATLGLAWLICLAPRLAAIGWFWPDIIFSTQYIWFNDGALAGTAIHDPYHPALYPWFAFLLWKATGGLMPLYLAVHVALHALIGPLVWLLALGMSLPRRVAQAGLVAVAFLPYYVSLAARQLDVGLIVVLFAALLVTWVRWVRGGFGWRWGLAHALVAFLFFLGRPNSLSVTLSLYGLALGIAWYSRRWELRRLGTPLVLLLLLLVGWAGLNGVRFGHFTPFSANGGVNLYGGNNPHVRDYIWRYDIQSLVDIRKIEGLPPGMNARFNSYEMDADLRRHTLAYMRANPGETIRNAILKGIRYWDFRLDDAALNSRLDNALYTIPYLIYAPLALFGLVRLARAPHQRFALLVIVTAIVAYWLPHIVVFGTIRYRMTTEFLLLLLAAYGLFAPASVSQPHTAATH